jgi:hypothetical protein
MNDIANIVTPDTLLAWHRNLPDLVHVGSTGEIRRRERLGGMLNYYCREAA